MKYRGAATATGCTATIICKSPLLNLNQNSVLGMFEPCRAEAFRYKHFVIYPVAKEFSTIATVRCGMTAAEADDNGSFSTDFVCYFNTLNMFLY